MLSGPEKRRWILIAGACALYAALAGWGLTQPFLRHREGICATHAVHARNHVLYGLSTTKLGNLELGGTSLAPYVDYRDDFYPNRPPLSVLGPAAFFWVLGSSEGVYRFNLVLVGCLSILVFSGVARRLLQAPWDIVAVYIFALMPIFTYFSHIANHLDYVILFALLAWYANLRLEEGRRFRVLLFVAIFLACESDWPGYFAAFSIAVHRFRGWKSGLSASLIGLALGCFAVHLLHLWWLGPDIRHIKRFLIGGHDRSIMVSPALTSYVVEEGREILVNFTVAVVGMAVLGGVAAARARQGTVFFLALLGLEELVFTYIAYYHDFLTLPLAPFVATLAAGGASWLWNRRNGRALVLAAGVLAAAQAVWVQTELMTRDGDYEVAWKAALAIREASDPREPVLLTIGDTKRLNQYYSERHVTSREAGTDRYCVRYAGTSIRIATDEALLGHLELEGGRYDLVVSGDLDLAERTLKKSREELERLGFCRPDHPLRVALDRWAKSREFRGPFVIYHLH